MTHRKTKEVQISVKVAIGVIGVTLGLVAMAGMILQGHDIGGE